MMQPDEQLRAATVLLVEDNPADQDLARRALDRGVIHCDLRVVSNGEEAMDYLRQREKFSTPASCPRPDLILLDLNMPRLDGRQVLERMRADSNLDTIPVVVLTTLRQEEDVVRSYKLGCNSFIQKPIEVQDFVAALEQLGTYWLKLVVPPPTLPTSHERANTQDSAHRRQPRGC